MIVLHVVDRTEGGVPNAVAAYIRNSAEDAEHHVISPFEAGRPHPVWRALSAAVHHDLGAGVLTRIRAVARLARQIRPDVLHAHSSFSGVYVRLARTRLSVRIVYTPHGYSFQRRDIGRWSRAVFYAIETVLGANTSAVAACSPVEIRLSRRIPTIGKRVVYVPNVSTISPRTSTATSSGIIRRFGMLGRVSAAKDPEYFTEVANRIQSAFPGATAVWIGNGDAASVNRLEQHGVKVTGWVEGRELVDEIDRLDLYIHTSAWESFPLAVLDVHARRVPMLVRAIPAFDKLDQSMTLEKGLDRLLDPVADVGSLLDEIRSHWDDYLTSNHDDAQRDALVSIWKSGGHD